MNLTFNEEIFKNCRNKEPYFQYIEELVLLGREVQDNGITAFESEKWQNIKSVKNVKKTRKRPAGKSCRTFLFS